MPSTGTIVGFQGQYEHGFAPVSTLVPGCRSSGARISCRRRTHHSRRQAEKALPWVRSIRPFGSEILAARPNCSGSSPESGNSEAQYRLASLYRTGRGVPRDDLLAFKWMKAAAERNHSNAQLNLARMYLAGRAVALDVAVARAWLQKATSGGNDEAARLLSEISVQSRIEPDRPSPTQPPSRQTLRAPSKAEASSQPGSATALRNEHAGILEAARRGQTDALRTLISSGANIAAKDDDGSTALLLAASAGKIETANVLLSAHADVNAENKLGQRPLMAAAARGYVRYRRELAQERRRPGCSK